MVTKLGIVGLNEGNGHPFSFSAIINGYDEQEMINSGWEIINDYLRERDIADFGFPGVEVTHCWTQDKSLTMKLARACLIPNPLSKLEEMINKVDGVIIARDDFEKHYELALPFLQAGQNVFVDKPLTLNMQELTKLKPFLENGQLMSCSGMRYAIELDSIRKNLEEIGELYLIKGTAPNCWEKYGVHLLEAIYSTIKVQPVAIIAVATKITSVTIELENGAIMEIANLGKLNSGFKLELFGTKGRSVVEIKDNFMMFRRTLWHFINLIKTGNQEIPPNTTINIIKLLIAGQKALKEQRKVYFSEFNS